MKRLYESIINEHFAELNQMALLPGPRQVGKTTIAKKICSMAKESLYLNWDYPTDRALILSGPDKVIEKISPPILNQNETPVVAFDEIHKYKNWKNYLKGYYDYSKDQINTIVTGSAKLDVYKKGGDSLMGRYFLYHIHPLSVGELLERRYTPQRVFAPQALDEQAWQALFLFGGFPDPYLKQNMRFLNRWQQLRLQQLFQEDIKSLSDISDLAQMEVLAQLLNHQASHQVNYHRLAKMVQTSDKTAKRWLTTLESFYYCFTIKPWSKNISRSLVKEPKLYLWDWSMIKDHGAKVENFIAGHLLKAVHYWNDIGLGNYQLYYLRDKDKRKADFLITQDNTPWIIAEVKSSNNQPISKNLYYFQEATQARHAFQIVFDMPYIDKDCFSADKPTIVPAKTLLSQLI